MIDVEAILKNSNEVGPDGKKRSAFMAAIGWDNFVSILEQLTRLKDIEADQWNFSND